NALTEADRLRGQSRWSEALASVTRAEGVLAHGSGDENLRRRVQRLRADLEMVATLDEVRLLATEVNVKVSEYDGARLGPAYEKAFQDYGIDVVALDAAEAAERIRARSIAVELSVALVDWADTLRRVGKGKTDWRQYYHLLAVARLANPDPWRKRL